MDPMVLGAAANAEALFASTANGPLVLDWAVFAATYGSVITPMQGAVDANVGALAAWLLPILRWIMIFAIASTALAAVISDRMGTTFPLHMILPLLLRGAIVFFLIGSAANIDQWVVRPMLALPNEIAGVLLGATGEQRIIGGAPFDTLWVAVYRGVIAAWKATSFLTFDGIVLGLVTLFAGLFAALCIWFVFAIFLVNSLLLLVLMSVVPLAIGAAILQQTRFLLRGWVAASTGVIVTLVLLAVMLAILIHVEQGIVNKIANAPPNANAFGIIGTMFGAIGVLFMSCILTVRIERMSLAIASGVAHGAGAYLAAAGTAAATAARGAGRMLGLGGGRASSGGGGRPSGGIPQPAFRAAGRSLSGGRP